MDTLAKRLTARREELGLTPTDLADIAGISVQAVIKWETGQTLNLKHEHLFLIADALNLNPRWLAIGEGQKIANHGREAYRMALGKRDKSGNDRVRRAWERVAAGLAKAAAILMVFGAGALLSPDSKAAFSRLESGQLHIMLNRLRALLFRRFAILFRRFGMRYGFSNCAFPHDLANSEFAAR